MPWIVIDIGCIECGSQSNVVGVYSDEARAAEIAVELNSNQDFSWRGGGQHSFEVFPLPTLDVVNKEYENAPSNK